MKVKRYIKLFKGFTSKPSTYVGVLSYLEAHENEIDAYVCAIPYRSGGCR